MSELLQISEAQINVYDSFRAQLAELDKDNSSAVFDYADETGNKDARSHVFKLRKTKTAVDKARKAEKEQSLQYGRLVDSEAKEITLQLEKMIQVHAGPLKEIEDKEIARVKAHETALAELQDYSLLVNQGDPSDKYQRLIENLKLLEPDERFEEFTALAITEYKSVLAVLESGLASALKSEHEQAELEKLRAEKAAREQAEREERIAKEAREQAERAAREFAEKAEQEAKEAIERVERDKQQALQDAIDAEKRAKDAENQAEADARQRLIDEAKAETLEQEKREADKSHRKQINNEALDALLDGGVSATAAKLAVSLIAKKKIPHIAITY